MTLLSPYFISNNVIVALADSVLDAEFYDLVIFLARAHRTPKILDAAATYVLAVSYDGAAVSCSICSINRYGIRSGQETTS